MSQAFASIVALAATSSAVLAGVTVPFVEDFSDGLSGFTANNATQQFVTENGNGFARVNATLSTRGFPAVNLISANLANNPSNGAFSGNYTAAQITRVTFDVRHNGPAPLNFYLRLTQAPANFPAFLVLSPVPVAAGNGFTTVSFDISATNPLNIPEGPISIPGILSNVGNFQLLVGGPAQFNGTVVTLDVDNVRLVPTPATAGVLGLGGVVAMRRRRGA